MELKGVLIGAIIVMMLVSSTTTYVSASQEKPEQTQIYVEEEIESGFYRDDGFPKDTKDRPAINPDFAPDRSCDLKWELKCIPGTEQKCSDLRGYNNGEMNVCTPIGCPDGYHNNFEWEDNVCYSNEIDCQDDWVLVKGAYGDTCEPSSMHTYLVYASVNSDGDMINDIPPDGEGYFCDHPSNPGSCYDRNDNPEYFCVNNPQYTDFCEIIEPICDDEDQIKSSDPECTEEDSPCPENYVRYNEYCAQYRVDCDENPTNVYCTGQRRTDGLQRCDEPEHPGYKFCNRDN